MTGEFGAETAEERIARYRRLAEDARSEAAIADHTSTRVTLREVAAAWDRLADNEGRILQGQQPIP